MHKSESNRAVTMETVTLFPACLIYHGRSQTFRDTSKVLIETVISPANQQPPPRTRVIPVTTKRASLLIVTH
ncbi:hypothetical protein HUJ05_000333 [Dendroctonus ponderosae]|nr:hypothetical protein HUJ05_000333 [Dendroctonus ponderosae]